MTKQSAPASVTARAATAASAAGLVPYTYCQAHTRRPPAFRSLTSWGVNCDQNEVPSPLFTNTVEMPCALAWATIAPVSPPFALSTYQIHIPLPSNAVPDGACTTGGEGEVEV